MGMMYSAGDLKFQWFDGSFLEEGDFTNWKQTGEPSMNGECVSMILFQGYVDNGRWASGHCTSGHSTLCEKAGEYHMHVYYAHLNSFHLVIQKERER